MFPFSYCKSVSIFLTISGFRALSLLYDGLESSIRKDWQTTVRYYFSTLAILALFFASTTLSSYET